MTTPQALAQARHQQALAALAETEAELLAAMKTVEPTFTGTAEAMLDRKWESKVEGPRPLWELAHAHSAFRRAQRAEAKARSAAYRATLVAVPAAPPAPPARRKKAVRKSAFADQVRQHWADEAEARAA